LCDVDDPDKNFVGLQNWLAALSVPKFEQRKLFESFSGAKKQLAKSNLSAGSSKFVIGGPNGERKQTTTTTPTNQTSQNHHHE
jgi:hypothetical protein